MLMPPAVWFGDARSRRAHTEDEVVEVRFVRRKKTRVTLGERVHLRQLAAVVVQRLAVAAGVEQMDQMRGKIDDVRTVRGGDLASIRDASRATRPRSARARAPAGGPPAKSRGGEDVLDEARTCTVRTQSSLARSRRGPPGGRRTREPRGLCDVGSPARRQRSRRSETELALRDDATALGMGRCTSAGETRPGLADAERQKSRSRTSRVPSSGCGSQGRATVPAGSSPVASLASRRGSRRRRRRRDGGSDRLAGVGSDSRRRWRAIHSSSRRRSRRSPRRAETTGGHRRRPPARHGRRMRSGDSSSAYTMPSSANRARLASLHTGSVTWKRATRHPLPAPIRPPSSVRPSAKLAPDAHRRSLRRSGRRS